MFFFMQTNGNQNDLPASKADGNMQQYEYEALLDRNGKPSRKSVYETWNMTEKTVFNITSPEQSDL